MSVLVDEYTARVSVFFWMSMPQPVLIKVLKDAGFEVSVAEQLPAPLPGLKVEVSPRPIGRFKSVNVFWHDARYELIFEGKVSEVADALESVKEGFERVGYKLDSICRYVELNFRQPYDVKNFVDSLRKRLHLSVRIMNEDLRPFAIMLANAKGPIPRENFEKWFFIGILPDPNSPENRVIVEIVKRSTDVNTIVKLLRNIGNIIEGTITQVSQARR